MTLIKPHPEGRPWCPDCGVLGPKYFPLSVFGTTVRRRVLGPQKPLSDWTNGMPKTLLVGYFYPLAKPASQSTPRSGCRVYGLNLNIGAEIITNTIILGVPYYIYSIVCPKTLF